MSRYDAVEDPLCYLKTQVLKNKAGIRDQEDLDQFEQLMFLTRAEENLPGGALDFTHYKAIHHHFFQDVYDWAGQIREIRTGKGGNWFCYPEYIDAEMQRIFSELDDENHLTDLTDIVMFAGRASHYIGEINAVHPFREGNGRCQLTLLNILFEISGRKLDEDRLEPKLLMEAMISSFHGDNEPLSKAIVSMSD